MSTTILGTFGAAHLGDALCASPLPRLLSVEQGHKVYVENTSNYRNVFKGNPFVSSYIGRKGPDLRRRFHGVGHIIQRFQQGFHLTVAAEPRPELYLDDEERHWAAKQRETWPTGKPILFVATRAIVDKHHLAHVDWKTLSQILSKRFTLVQSILTNTSAYSTKLSPLTARECEAWQAEPILPGAVVYQDLSVRRYFALMSTCDGYLGPPSGGSHVAAAFRLPSLILIWDEVMRRLQFPECCSESCVNVFLYPYHHFISASELTIARFDNIDLARQLMLLRHEIDHPESVQAVKSTVLINRSRRRLINTTTGRLASIRLANVIDNTSTSDELQ